MDPFDYNSSERATLPRNMIENTMFEEEPDVVDLARDSAAYPTFPALDPDETAYEPRSSRLLVRGLGENDVDDDDEDCESSARLLGMSFMNRSASQRSNASIHVRQSLPRSCSPPSARTTVVCVLFLVIVASMTMVLYFLPGCNFTKMGCPKQGNKTSNGTDGELFPWAQYQLPRSVRPLSYDLTFTPDFSTMDFSGHTVINMFVLHNTKRIVLHSAHLNISKATFKLGDGEASDVTILEYLPREQIAVKFSEELKAGQRCVLTLDYAASLSHTYDGFYNSSYTDQHGNKRVLAATQFEPLYARKAFPCFDEPSFKATFLVKINRKPEYMTLSNMPQLHSTQLASGLVQDEFAKTSVNMSTYLVAFVVGNFTSVSKNVSDILVSVYSVPEKKAHTNYALDTASKLLEFYNGYFEINYPLQKLDLVAVPDFLAGAMENWGLITFRETGLLLGGHSSLLQKQSVAAIIAHELAHQWFGNLVTMSWWSDLWLNEGFATFMEFMSVQRVLPELDMSNLFLAMRFRTLDRDALNSSHAVSTEVSTPEQVQEMFDSVSYQKGASILLMLNTSLPGDQQFRKGIIQYLKQFAGLNTDTDDLWNSLTEVEVSSQHPNVSEMMRSWTSQKGFPLVTVSRTGDVVNLKQEIFQLTSDNSKHSSSLWNIPVTYVNDSCSLGPECKQLFVLNTQSGTFKVAETVKWLKLNYRSTGFYIVDYGEEGWAALTDAMTKNFQVLTQEDRASLIHNIFALSRLGRVSFRQVLNLLKYMPNETESSPVREALLQLQNIYQMLQKRYKEGLVSRMKAHILKDFGVLMDKQTWTKEESISKQDLRSALLEMACHLGQEKCTQQATAMFKQYVASNGTSMIPGDLQRVVFTVAAQSNEDWESLLTLYHYATYDSEKQKLLEGLASTQDTQKMVWLLNAGLNSNMIQIQNLPLVVHRICQGLAGNLIAWDFIQENWNRLTQTFPVGSYALQSLVKSTTSHFSEQSHLNQVQCFFASLSERGSQMRSAQEALETIRLNQSWMEKNLPSLDKWL
ncbi:leucyl-cystinyl aminopeptidase [Syngnathoides biaculeatus]|uniref:leucyl-cystinyl aminopeptidase n=1 Tax=Syngnathoides biaculeatus TaxID=300417 RepID=UPI002ADD55A1|nr:leucyl-cystinyl aminopeptidase [Syngnathoides biaculeatus]